MKRPVQLVPILSLLVAASLPFIVGAQEIKRDENGKVEDRNRGFHERMVKRFKSENASVKPGGIVFVGDSITQGLPTSLLRADLPIYNRGISGDKIGNHYYGVLDRMEESIYDLNPAQIYLLIGINNFAYWKTPGAIMDAGYERLLGEIKKNCPKAKLYVQSVMPLRGGWAKCSEQVLTVNTKLQAMCKKHGVTYVDLHKALRDSKGELKKEFTADGLHLNFKGYVAWVDCLDGISIGIERNLTTNKPVTVSGGTEGQQVPEQAVDGLPDNATGWHASPAPQWLQVDLEAVYELDRLNVYMHHDGSRHYQYTVELSKDGKAWTRVLDRSSNTRPATRQGDAVKFARTAARYVRVNLLKNSANFAVHLNEIQVFEAGK